MKKVKVEKGRQAPFSSLLIALSPRKVFPLFSRIVGRDYKFLDHRLSRRGELQSTHAHPPILGATKPIDQLRREVSLAMVELTMWCDYFSLVAKLGLRTKNPYLYFTVYLVAEPKCSTDGE